MPLLSDWNGALAKRFGAARVWRWMGASRGAAPSSSARTVRCSDRGGTRTRTCPTRRAARGRAGIAGLAVALYLGAGVLATSPAVFETDHFLGYGAPREGRVAPGDHLQTAYNLWLPGHQLARGAAALARSVQLPAGGRAARELCRLAVRGRLRAAAGALRDGGGVEPLHPADLRSAPAPSPRSGCARSVMALRH